MATQHEFELEKATEELMNNHMDPTHDYSHVLRVRKLALKIAKTIPGINISIVSYGALLHDILDHKLVKDPKKVEEKFRLLLLAMFTFAEVNKIMLIVKNVSYSKERKGEVKESFPELHIVQDADKLDAMGGMGIARCVGFGCQRGNPLIGENSCISHFKDKLFHLQKYIKTEEGKKLAKRRHSRLKMFYDWVQEENEYASD